MIKRQQVLDYILNEAERLQVEEHIDDLLKAERYEELRLTECKISHAVMQYLTENKVYLENKNIPKGKFFAIALLVNTLCLDNLVLDEERFTVEIELETGRLGKSLARRIRREGRVVHVQHEDFFNATDPYDEDE